MPEEIIQHLRTVELETGKGWQCSMPVRVIPASVRAHVRHNDCQTVVTRCGYVAKPTDTIIDTFLTSERAAMGE